MGDKIEIGDISNSENFAVGSDSRVNVQQQETGHPNTAVPTTESTEAVSSKIPSLPQPTIGIVTALPKEYVAMQAVLQSPKEFNLTGGGAGRRYLLGHIPSTTGGSHIVALTLAGMGNNGAATRGTLLLEHFPTIQSIIMVGIAGGVPNPNKAEDHVRLGDIVISNQGGVVQYDFDKELVDKIIHRHAPRPPSALLLEAVELLETKRLTGARPWLTFIDTVSEQLNITRPADALDVLADSNNPEQVRPHPVDPDRLAGCPRIHLGPIASANKLLKNPLKRDQLRDQFGVKAVEMEASGIADATWNREAGYLVVRGICDYCDANKGDDWQAYAAVVAAAYTRSLLESMPEMSSVTSSGNSPKLIPTLEPLTSFQAIYQRLEARSEDEDVDKNEVIELIQYLEAEVPKENQANPKKVERWLLELYEIAPDIFTATLTYLRSPEANLSPILHYVVETVQERVK